MFVPDRRRRRRPRLPLLKDPDFQALPAFFPRVDLARVHRELDLAFGLTHTSRLGCQIRMSEALDGLVVKLPPATRNMMVDK